MLLRESEMWVEKGVSLPMRTPNTNVAKKMRTLQWVISNFLMQLLAQIWFPSPQSVIQEHLPLTIVRA